MSFGFGFSLPAYYGALRVGGARSPSTLFANNEPGVWYDPSDLSTLFQDSAGATPVTAVERPVGLMLDKSKGLVLGPEIITNGDFSNGSAGWTLGASFSVSGGALTVNAASADSAYQTPTDVSGNVFVVEFVIVSISSGSLAPSVRGRNGNFVNSPGLVRQTIRAGSLNAFIGVQCAAGTVATIDNISVRELPGFHATQTTATSRPVLSARVNRLTATAALTTQTVTTRATTQTLRFEGTGTITLSGTATGTFSAGTHSVVTTAGSLTLTVSGAVTNADLRESNVGVNLPAYQAVVNSTTYTTAGFPHYLRFDGVDDFLLTPTITPNANKAQVFAGVRKLSDAVAFMGIVEYGDVVAANGSLSVSAPTATGAATYEVALRGTQTTASNLSPFAAPITSVLSAAFDIGQSTRETEILSRVNALTPTLVGTGSANAGGGNFLAYPLYIGRRGGTSFPFNGHLYSLIVRFGSNLPAATIENTENYINTKTRAF